MCRLLLGLDMDEVGVYCSWDMPGRPSIIPSMTFLGKGPSLPQGSWWCVLRVRSKGVGCLSTEGSRPVYRLEYLLFGAIGILGHSWFDPSCTVVPSHSSALLGILSSPSFPRVVPHLVCVLFPHPIHLPPSCSPLSSFSFFVPSHQLLALHSLF